MIEPRLYRVAFLPALVVLALLMFSFESRPPPLPQGLAADVLFDGELAAAGARSVASTRPDRRPGSPGNLAAAADVASELRDRGFVTRTNRFEGPDERPLANVVGVRPGASPRRVVLMAARDSGGGPETAGSAADTAALLEFARVLAGRATAKTVVLASVDGSTVGEAGVRHFARTEGDASLVDAVLVVSNLGAPGARGPVIVEWSNDGSRASIGWQRTVATSVREELGALPEHEGVPGQLVRLALPLGVGAQGPLLADGYPALRLSGSGELAPETAAAATRGAPVEGAQAPPTRVDPDRLGELGRAALRSLSAVDSGPAPEAGPDTYLIVADQVLPGWVVSVLALALLLPAVFVSVDAFARARRRRDSVVRWAPWLAMCTLPWLAGLGVAYLLALTGAVPAAPGATPSPAPGPPGAVALLVLAPVAGACAVSIGLAAWRRSADRGAARDADASLTAAAPGAACACALLASFLGIAVWVVNPFAGLLIAPTVHLWILATTRRRAPRRGGDARPVSVRARVGLALTGLVPVLIVAAYYMDRLALGPLEAPWYLMRVVAGGHAGFVAALLGCLFGGLLTAVVGVLVAIARGRTDSEGGGPSVPVTGGSDAYDVRERALGAGRRRSSPVGTVGRSFYRPVGGPGR